MPLPYEHVGSKKPAKINTYMLTRAELLITLCYEIPCILIVPIMYESAKVKKIQSNKIGITIYF